MMKNIFSAISIVLAIIASVSSYSRHQLATTDLAFTSKDHNFLRDHACGELPMIEAILLELTDDDIAHEGKKNTGISKSFSKSVLTPGKSSSGSFSKAKSSKSFIQIFPALYIFIRVLRI